MSTVDTLTILSIVMPVNPLDLGPSRNGQHVAEIADRLSQGLDSHAALYVDNVFVTKWFTDPPLNPNFYVCLGRVGIVAARELSRLSRSSRDWQQLIEVSRFVHTLLADHGTAGSDFQTQDGLIL